MSAARNCLHSAVVVNDHMYPHPHLHHFSMFLRPLLGQKHIIYIPVPTSFQDSVGQKADRLSARSRLT